MNRIDRRWLWVALVLVVVAVAFVSSSRRRSGPPYDPTSTDPDGARALVVFLEGTGAEVDITDDVPDGSAGVVFVLDDRMPNAQADAVDRFARNGGTVVVADDSSLLSPPSRPVDVETLGGTCDDGSLADVDELVVGDDARAFDVGREPSTIACFAADGAAFVVAEPRGAGRVISIGEPAMFTNEFLDEADNAVLAAALLGGDDSHVTFLTPAATDVGSGDQSVLDLVPDSVKAFGWQAVVVFLFAIWWRARRLGAPVPEPQPVTIDGSELTRAVGRLLESNRRPDRAAALLRDRARVDLGPRLGLSADPSVSDVAAALSGTTSLTADEIHLATAAQVTTDEQLLLVSRLLSRIREEVLHGIHPT